MKYPRSVFFIISNEFCERFCYYGMRAILGLYMRSILRYNDDQATELFHTFVMLCYLFPIFGAIIADSYIGKYKTILYLSILYTIGCLTLSLSSITVLGLPQRIVSLFGLLLIAIGTGGIKPCVSSLGGDQFILPEQQQQLQRFFSYFYATINAGALLSMVITPILREDVKCFGENSCFPMAFGIPAILMLIALCIFIIGTPLYVRKNPEGNVIVTTVKCIWSALKNKYNRSSNDEKKEHWLDYADEKFSIKQVADIKAMSRILILLIPAPIYWALYDQQVSMNFETPTGKMLRIDEVNFNLRLNKPNTVCYGSRWVFQATRMDGRILGYTIKPDQIHIVDPLLVIVFIPLFENYLYPCMNKLKLNTSLRKLSIGGILVAVSFVMSAVLEFQLEKTYISLPNKGESQLWLFNSLDCNLTVESEYFVSEKIPTLSGHRFSIDSVNGSISVPLNISADSACNGVRSQTFVSVAFTEEGRISSYVISSDDTAGIVTFNSYTYEGDLEKNLNGQPKLRIFYAGHDNDSVVMKVISSANGDTEEIKAHTNVITKFINLPMTVTARYDIYANNTEIMHNLNLDPGSIVTVLVRDVNNNNNGNRIAKANVVHMVPPNSVHILWQLPQIIVITISEVMFSVTGLEFCFTQAPDSMKAVSSAAWLLTTTFGNLLVVVISGIKIFKRQAYEFLLYAVLMLVDMAIFMALANNYRYGSRSN